MAKRQKQIVAAFSGGKDSTALAYMLRPKYLLYTSTGNELPPVEQHIQLVAADIGAEVIRPPGPTLAELIAQYRSLPNYRMRWCTHRIKVLPAMKWMKDHPDVTLAVGLRHDEPTRKGIYGLDPARFIFPLRDEKMDVGDVWGVIKSLGIDIPIRTDCAICFFQRLGEWYQLWRDWPAYWREGEDWESFTGHTFRSPSRDTWPAAMQGLRREFERGRIPRGGESTARHERRN